MTVFVASEEIGSEPPSSAPYYGAGPWIDYDGNCIWRSTDGGASWSVVTNPARNGKIVLTGAIATDGCAVYAQQQNVPLDPAVPDVGLIRSTDLGLTWQHVGGPALALDTVNGSVYCTDNEISVVGNGAVVYANDGEGNLWKTTDGGDGALTTSTSAHVLVDSFRAVAACASSRTLTKLFGVNCANSLTLTNASLVGDTTHFILDSMSLPLSLGGGTSDSFYIHFNPNNVAGTFSTTLHIIGTIVGLDTSLPFDTLITINATSVPVPIDLAPSVLSFGFGSVSTCHGFGDTSLVFTNLGCGPDTITSMSLTGPGFSGDTIPIPIIVASGDSLTLRYHFVPPGVGTDTGSLTLHVVSMGLTEDPVIALSGTGTPADAMLSLSNTSLAFGSFSRCNAAGDTTVTLTNLGCDSLALSGAAVAPGTGFTLVEGNDTVLAPNESVAYRIAFADSLVGNLTSALTLHAIGADGGRAFNTSIALSAAIVPGTKLAALNPEAIDFGTTSICEERDSSLTITNTGCEPDTITAIFFTNSCMVPGSLPALPLIIPVGGQAVLPILTQLDTTGHPASNADTLLLSGNLDAPLPPVIFSRGVVYPGSFGLAIASEDSAPVKTIVPVYVLRNGTVPIQANELDFDLIYDDDLLSYDNLLQPDIYSTNASLLPNGLTDRSFAMRPAMDRDTIATILFQSYLTKHEQTPIILAGQKFLARGETSPPCVASLDTSASDTRFTLELTCGEEPIAKGMQGLPITIIAMEIAPDKLVFKLARGDARYANCDAEVLNILGAPELTKQMALQAVSSESFDIRSLPAGAYFLRVESNGYVMTRRFAIIR